MGAAAGGGGKVREGEAAGQHNEVTFIEKIFNKRVHHRYSSLSCRFVKVCGVVRTAFLGPKNQKDGKTCFSGLEPATGHRIFASCNWRHASERLLLDAEACTTAMDHQPIVGSEQPVAAQPVRPE